MNYNEAINYIQSTAVFGSVLGLSRITELLALLDNPQDKLKIIHIGGTNGKGSTCSYVSEILKNNGHKVGLYISPYVTEFCEGIQINGKYIDEISLAKYTTMVKQCIKKMQNHPTQFEIVCAIAFLYFYMQNCDYVVLEVGLGGEFDATNVIKRPVASVLTHISMDHMDYLGDTIQKIAKAKCGIIKEDSVVISYPYQEKVVQDVILDNLKGSKYIQINPNDISIKSMDITGSVFDYKHHKDIKIKMLGQHQIYNAVCAIEVADLLNIKDISLESVSFVGRFQIKSNDPLVIFDGAHNYDGVSAFVNAVKLYFSDKKKIIVFGMLADKEYQKCVKEIGCISDVFIALTPSNSRALDGNVLGSEAKKYCNNVFVAKDIADAVKIAKKNYTNESVIFVCGSLYLLSDFLSDNLGCKFA